MPKPKVARARYTPDRRMAGMASMAPSGTVARPASNKAANHGTWAPVVRWANELAPRAAKAAWHSEIWPDVHTSSANETKMRTKVAALVYTGSLVPASFGTASKKAPPTTPAVHASRGGIGLLEAGGRRR